MHQMYEKCWGGFGMMIFWWIFIIVAVVALTTWIVRQNPKYKNKSALATLKERYARGEISQNEYEEKKRDIAGQ